MADIWRMKPGALTDSGGETWDVYCGDEHLGEGFESRDEADDFIREFLGEEWSTDWPGAEGWYWFWDPSFPELVEPAQMRFFANGIIYTRSSEELREQNYPGCHWHVMEKPPTAPVPQWRSRCPSCGYGHPVPHSIVSELKQQGKTVDCPHCGTPVVYEEQKKEKGEGEGEG